MTLFFADLVREVTRATGAGELALEGAVPGHRGFADVVPDGARFLYAIAGVTRPEEWETGEGEIVAGKIVRAPQASSAGGAAVAFTAGLKTVVLTATASWYAAQEAGGVGGGDVGIDDVDGLTAALAGKAAAAHHHDASYASASHHHNAAYQPVDAELSAIAGLTGAADRVAYFTGPGAAALTTLSGFGRGLIDDADAAAARGTLGLGTVATRNTGTSGSAVPLLDGANNWSAAQAVAGTVTLSSSGVDVASGRIVTPALRIEGSAPAVNIKDTDSSGAAITGSFGFFDSGNSQVARFGRPYGDGNLWIENDGGTMFFGLSIGNAAAQLTGGAFDLLGGRAYRVGGSQVVGARIAGWSAATGTATRTAFDTASVTTAALAERVKALIDDLRAHGLIGN